MVTNRGFGDSYGPAFATNIMMLASQNAATLYGMMTAALMYTRVARNDASNYQLEVSLGAKAIEALNQALCRPVPIVSDAIIWAVLALGYSGYVGELRTGKRPRQSFLRELQSLHIYGRLVINQAHVSGLIRLVQMIGGIDQLKTPGIAQVMSLYV